MLRRAGVPQACFFHPPDEKIDASIMDMKRISSGLLLRPALELLLHIASELSNGIRAALPAVPHLLDDLPQLILNLSLLLRRWGLDMSELVLGYEGHDIMDEHPHGL